MSHGHIKRVNGRRTASPTYQSWQLMKGRCLNPQREKYLEYGGRGITVCERWMKFENFLADMGVRPAGMTLDRIDNDGHYEPSNCRWATPAQQNANQRARRDRVSWFGHAAKYWARQWGVHPATANRRIHRYRQEMCL